MLQHLRGEGILWFAVCGVQEHSSWPQKPLQVDVFCEVRAESHVATMYILSPIRKLEQELHSSCA